MPYQTQLHNYCWYRDASGFPAELLSHNAFATDMLSTYLPRMLPLIARSIAVSHALAINSRRKLLHNVIIISCESIAVKYKTSVSASDARTRSHTMMCMLRSHFDLLYYAGIRISAQQLNYNCGPSGKWSEFPDSPAPPTPS